MSDTTLTDGSPVTKDHRELNPETGMQRGYIVLSDEERAKGFIRPVRRSYIHLTCGTMTSMGKAIAETYAHKPSFYSDLFCAECKDHFPVGASGSFVWDNTTNMKVGT